MVNNDVKVEVFSSLVNCDRYHLIKINGNLNNNDIIYTEEGKAFNGFSNPLILNCNYDLVSKSKMLALSIRGINGFNRVFYLITAVEPLRNDKTIIYIEYDTWMNDIWQSSPADIRLGEQNYLFQCSDYLIDYPASDISTRFFKYEKIHDLTPAEKWNIIMFYHDSELNVDRVYLILSNKTNYVLPIYTIEFDNFMNNAGLDTNNIIGMYFSPFSVYWSDEHAIHTAWVKIQETPFEVYYMLYASFIIESPLHYVAEEIRFDTNPKEKAVIIDGTGSTVWTSSRKYVGAWNFLMFLDVSYGSCFWNGIVGMPQTHSQDVENRFTIPCIDLGYFLDYYQQYSNIQRGYNTELRQAQLEKQLIDGVGDVVASTLWHGTSSGAPAPNATGIKAAIPATSMYGIAGGAVGGSVQIALNTYSTSEYNKKINTLENKQARVQYDTISSNTMSLGRFISGQTVPALYRMYSDDQSMYVGYDSVKNTYNRLNYNCYIYSNDLKYLITQNNPRFISGDFDFLGLNEVNTFQLNSRFKHGVNFVDWKDS